MPLRRIVIDWGDGTDMVGGEETQPVNYYKNKREKCDTTENGAGGGWAGDSKACDSGEPFSYQHTYLFKEAVQDSKHCGQIGILLGDAFEGFQKQFPNIAQNKPACVYTPKVQLLDNWGWCNANGTGGKPECVDFKNGVFGCYDNDSNGEVQMCYKGIKPGDPTPWTSFAGKVIVLP